MNRTVSALALALTLGLTGCTGEPGTDYWDGPVSTERPPVIVDPPPTTPTPEQTTPAPDPTDATYTVGTVVRTVDGDTVRVQLATGEEVAVRVIGINTPETKHPTRGVECGGPEASAAAAGLLPSGALVHLEYDDTQGETNPDTGRPEDRYGRVLAYVRIGGLGGTDYGLAMIQAGHAAEYTYRTAYARQAEYRTAHDLARGNLLGMWGACAK